MTTYARQDVTFVRGEGVWLWDAAGKQYFDALCGIAVCGLGHAHPRVTEAVCLQAGELLHTSNLYRIELQERLGEKLTQLSGLKNAFFCNSGAEANEVAIKIARRYGHERGVARPTIACMDGSFHGRTMATLSATGNPKVHAGFEPLVQGFMHLPFGDAEAARGAMREHDELVAILVEPVQGEGGIVIPPQGYLSELREICDRHQALLVFDEVQSGMARTGKWFGFQHEAVQPDVMTLAKSLGNGVPIGACLAGDAAAAILQPGTHGSTFGGNPLACRAALAVVDAIEEENILERCQRLSTAALAGLQKELGDIDGVVDIRAKGLMIGVELAGSCTELVDIARERGVLINVTADKVVRLLPPLVMSDEEMGHMVSIVCELIQAHCRAP